MLISLKNAWLVERAKDKDPFALKHVLQLQDDVTALQTRADARAQCGDGLAVITVVQGRPRR